MARKNTQQTAQVQVEKQETEQFIMVDGEAVPATAENIEAAAKPAKQTKAPRKPRAAKPAGEEATAVDTSKLAAALAAATSAKLEGEGTGVKFGLPAQVYPPLSGPDGQRNRFAYSFSVMFVEGMFGKECQPAAVPRARFASLFERPAMAYHIKQGNLADTPKGIMLTPKGANHFETRRGQSAQLIAEWVEYMTKGTGPKCPASGPIAVSA